MHKYIITVVSSSFSAWYRRSLNLSLFRMTLDGSRVLPFDPHSFLALVTTRFVESVYTRQWNTRVLVGNSPFRNATLPVFYSQEFNSASLPPVSPYSSSTYIYIYINIYNTIYNLTSTGPCLFSLTQWSWIAFTGARHRLIYRSFPSSLSPQLDWDHYRVIFCTHYVKHWLASTLKRI